MTSDPLAEERLRLLADPQALFGEWRGGDPVEGAKDCITALWFVQTDWAAEFAAMLYQSGWVLEDFGWPQWAETEEGKALLSDPAAIAVADGDQLPKLLTTLVRQDRFSEGTLATAFDGGVLLAAAERAERLLRQP